MMKCSSHDIAAKYKHFYEQGLSLLPLTGDFMFKKIMTNHPEFLKDLLHHITQIPLAHIGDIHYRNPELLPQFSDQKIYILDLLLDVMITDPQTGLTESRPFCVEMHSTSPSFVPIKISAYGHRLYNEQLGKGSDYDYNHVKEAYCIGIFKQNVSSLVGSIYIHRINLVSLDDPRNGLPGTQYWLVELAKFNKRFGELRTERDKILYFIKNADIIMKDPEQALHYIRLGGIMAEVIDYALDYSKSKEYQQILDYIAKERATRTTHMAENKAAGAAEERARGAIELKKVAAEREAKGRRETKLDLAKKLLAKDWDIAEVAEFTELDLSIIRELKSATS